uniref:Uncharacterized protein n=1 Tax=Aegilops tauschii TaxID=37682 RepID=M8B4H4_AEGTA
MAELMRLIEMQWVYVPVESLISKEERKRIQGTASSDSQIMLCTLNENCVQYTKDIKNSIHKCSQDAERWWTTAACSQVAAKMRSGGRRRRPAPKLQVSQIDRIMYDHALYRADLTWNVLSILNFTQA